MQPPLSWMSNMRNADVISTITKVVLKSVGKNFKRLINLLNLKWTRATPVYSDQIVKVFVLRFFNGRLTSEVIDVMDGTLS